MFQVLRPRPPVRGGQGLLAQPPAKVVYLRNSFEALLSESEIKVLAVVGQEGTHTLSSYRALFCHDSSYELLVIKQIKLNPTPTKNLSPVEQGCFSLEMVKSCSVVIFHLLQLELRLWVKFLPGLYDCLCYLEFDALVVLLLSALDCPDVT